MAYRVWRRSILFAAFFLSGRGSTVCKFAVSASVTGLFCLFFGTVSMAEDVVYPGAPLRQGLFDSSVNSIYPQIGWNNNTVTIYGGDPIPGNVAGGVNLLTQDGVVSGNSVVFLNGTVEMNVIGAITNSGTAVGNSVLIAGGTVRQKAAGGIALHVLAPDWGTMYLATGNSLTITGGTVGIEAYGGYSVGSATNNQLIVSGGSVGWGVAGGFASGSSGAPLKLGDASGNTVIISGGSVGSTGAAPPDAFLPVSGVYGGATQNGAAINNTVTLLGSPNLTAATLYGGLSASGGDVFTGNTLNVYGFQGTVTGIQNFQYYNFFLPASIAPGSTMLSVTATPPNMAGTTVRMGVAGGGAPLTVGHSVTLIDNTTNGPGRTRVQGLHGVSLLYDFDLEASGAALNATVAGVQLNPQTEALSEARAASMALVNQGVDLLIGQGMSAAQSAAAQGGVAGFSAASGGFSRYNTGSYADVNSFSFVTGLGWGMPGGKPGSALMLGVFFEAGTGDYDTHNSFSNAASITGNGDTEYLGGGILARYDAVCGGYIEASVRAGQVRTEFNSDNLQDFIGNKAGYDSAVPYYGAHTGLGYLWRISEKSGLDISTRYLWTHQGSDTVNILGDSFQFASSNSQRWRTGARFSHACTEQFIPYIGAAYDYEFDGKAKATTHGYSINAPSLKGATGIGELGFIFKPTVGKGVSLDLGIQGYTGVREGVTGSLRLKWEF